MYCFCTIYIRTDDAFRGDGSEHFLGTSRCKQSIQFMQMERKPRKETDAAGTITVYRLLWWRFRVVAFAVYTESHA